jgi:hypothetical protein
MDECIARVSVQGHSVCRSKLRAIVLRFHCLYGIRYYYLRRVCLSVAFRHFAFAVAPLLLPCFHLKNLNRCLLPHFRIMMQYTSGKQHNPNLFLKFLENSFVCIENTDEHLFI